MSLPTQTSALQPIKSVNDLIDVFVAAEKSRDLFKIGVEYERFAVLKSDGRPISYHGPKGAEQFLIRLAKDDWKPILENGNVVGLMGDLGTVSFEPGCQIEVSLAPFSEISQIKEKLSFVLNQMHAIANDLDLELIALGFHPTATREQISMVPRKRYEIMRNYMPKKGNRGIDMMLRTCTVQTNLDYVNESDMVASFRTALALSPIVTLLFANSDTIEGRQSAYLSERTMVWRDTDASRTGFPNVVFQQGFGYEAWVEWVLNVPMYLIRRGSDCTDVTGASFRDFMKNGLMGFNATMQDFLDHLTTIFTEVRIKPHIEMRSADCGSEEMVYALCAFWKGLIYNEKSRQATWELFENPTAQELASLQIDAATVGFKAKYRNRQIGALINDALEICSTGLVHTKEQNYLDILISLCP